MMNHLRNVLPLALTISITLLPGCERKPSATGQPGALAGQNVLLVTLDTTRADRLGCYGYTAGATPGLDALASRGTLFQHAYSPAPLTLPSHCSIFTGRYPREHGVHNNGRDALAPDVETLATIFKQRGYRTGAFVGSYVLDPRFGLNRGFDTYDADMGGVQPGVNRLEAERRADAVTDRALKWLPTADKQPFFCWIHYYDPHDPYDPPAPFRERFADPYDGEIAFVDTQFQRVIDWLAAANLTSSTLIVVLGDHGEAFGEHGENGHAIFLYDSTLHVPMILAHPGAIPAARQVDTDVELVDVCPTILELMGWPALPGLSSRSLAPALAGKLPPRACHAESLYALDAYGWAEQRSLRTPEWKYISSTLPELYDRRVDPQEQTNRAPDKPEVVQKLRELLVSHYEAQPPGQARQVALSAADRRSLESLGYVGGGHNADAEQFLTPDLPDPKQMLDVVADLQTARRQLRAGHSAEAIPLLQRCVERSPRSRLIHYDLGVGLLEAGQLDAAIAEMDAALRIDPRYAEALVALGDATLTLRRFDQAVEYFRAALALNDQVVEAQTGLARALQATGHVAEALTAYEKALALTPTYADVQAELGALLLTQNRVPEATRHLQEAVRLKPQLGTALNHLGIALVQQGRITEARESFTRATQIPAAAAEAYYNLGVTAGNEGNTAESVAQYERSLELDPNYMYTVEALTSFYLSQHRLTDAIRVLRVACAASPGNPRLSNALAWLLATTPDDKLRDGPQALELARRAAESTKFHDPMPLRTLAAAYAETGDYAQATQTAQRAVELAEASQQAALADALRAQLELYRAGRPYRASE